jgi:hypothetical protein
MDERATRKHEDEALIGREYFISTPGSGIRGEHERGIPTGIKADKRAESKASPKTALAC